MSFSFNLVISFFEAEYVPVVSAHEVMRVVDFGLKIKLSTVSSAKTMQFQDLWETGFSKSSGWFCSYVGFTTRLVEIHVTHLQQDSSSDSSEQNPLRSSMNINYSKPTRSRKGPWEFKIFKTGRRTSSKLQAAPKLEVTSGSRFWQKCLDQLQSIPVFFEDYWTWNKAVQSKDLKNMVRKEEISIPIPKHFECVEK